VGEAPNNPYANKSLAYFTRARTEIEPLLPVNAAQNLRVLEIGCSEGHTLEWLKKTGRCAWAAGVEPYAELRADPGSIDAFFKIDIEKELPPIAAASVDLILCLDVLEHLVDPWETVRRLDAMLKPGGLWIISVPNLRNYHIVMDLAFKGKFEYSESGILDRTHLRFFTRDSAVALAQSSGATVTQVVGTETTRWQKRLLNALGLGELIAKQHIVAARKPSN
jgi:2-polyprenyl-3-methyl-5-hydroxy-6-metoxy-1,4-benzoquinol methylase